MMTVVYVYGGEGRYVGSSIEWESPSRGSAHKVILFLAQTIDSPQQDLAARAVSELGFSELSIGVGKPIVVETLNDQKMAVFQKHYEGALMEGRSLVWYL